MVTSRPLFGRTVLYTDYAEITRENVIEVLAKVFPTHLQNSSDIDYLYQYYKGNQPVLYREKDFNANINNKIVVNRANEIVAFKTGYLMGEPVQYVARKGEKDADSVELLNDYMFSEDKATKDTELADWFHICGTSYRLVLPDGDSQEDEAPFEIYTLDPRNTFVLYYSGIGHEPVAGVTYVAQQSTGKVIFSVYTPTQYMELEYTGVPNAIVGNMDTAVLVNAPDTVVKVEDRIWGGIVPLVEYPANTARLGAFEIVLPLLDLLDDIASNREDGVDQFIQALLVLKGTDLDDEQFSALKDQGGLLLPPDGDAKYLTSQLNQTQTQTLVDDAYDAILTICGMPNRNGGTSTSDTGTAVIMRDGWSAAEGRAKTTEQMFKVSEKRFLRVVFEITNTLRDKNLKLSQVDIRFTRRNYENIQIKAQVLTTMLANPKIHPLLAFTHCGMFVDPDLAYEMSKEYADAKAAEEAASLKKFVANSTTEAANQTQDEPEAEVTETVEVQTKEDDA